MRGPDTLIAFEFDEAAASDLRHVAARIPAGIATKEELLARLAAGLSFPDYFGGNWDALDECIRDLSWLKSIVVTVVHRDLPLAADPAQQKTYLLIMNDAIAYWANQPEHKLTVVFPTESEALVRESVAAGSSPSS